MDIHSNDSIQKICLCCNTPNLSSAYYCRSCGRRIPSSIICPACSHINSFLPARFCSNCGHQLPNLDLAIKPLLIPFLGEGLVGYADYYTNQVFIEPRFVDGRMFSEGRAAVRLAEESGWTIIDETGRVILSKEFYDCSNYVNGLAIVEADRKYGLIDLVGNEVVPCEYSSIERKGSGYYHAQKDQKYYLFDSHAVCVFESNQYKVTEIIQMGSFPIENGLAKIYNNSLYGLIDLKGNEILPPTYYKMERFSDGLCAVARREYGVEKWGYINTRGEECIPCCFQEVGDFHDGVATFRVHYPNVKEHISSKGRKVQYPGGYFVDGLIDKSGRIVVEANKYHLVHSCEGLVHCNNDDGLTGFLNHSGEEVIPCQYKQGSHFHQGIAIVADEKGKWGAINTKGDVVIEFVHDFIVNYNTWNYSNLYIQNLGVIFKKNGKYGVVDFQGNTIIPFDYDELKHCKPNAFIVKVDKQYGLINYRGEYIIPLNKYAEIKNVFSPIDFGLVKVYKNFNESGLVDLNGNMRVPIKFFYINDENFGITSLWKRMFSLDQQADCLLSVRMRDQNKELIYGRADLFGNYCLDES